MRIEKNFLIILAGLPASGKSSFARTLKNFLEKEIIGFKVVIIDPDKIRKDISLDFFDPEKENDVRKSNLKKIRTELKSGNIVISDDLNYYTSMRNDLRKISDNLNLNYFILYIATPLDICLEWNEKREIPVPKEVIYKIDKKFDPFNKYQWDTPFKILDLSIIQEIGKEIEDLIPMIYSELEKPSDQDSETIKSPKTNIYHQNLDQITRKIIGTILESSKYHIYKKELSKHRKTFIKTYLEYSMDKSEISKKFKEFIRINTNIDIP